MALAAPDFFAGANDPERGARVLFNYAGWIRRLCNEITAESPLNVLKIYQLADQCFHYRAEADKWRVAGEITLVLQALVKLTRDAGVGQPTRTDAEINTDYKALYTAAGSFLTWAAANLPAASATVTSPTVMVNRSWPNPDLVVTVTKVAAVTTQVNALRAVFD